MTNSALPQIVVQSYYLYIIVLRRLSKLFQCTHPITLTNIHKKQDYDYRMNSGIPRQLKTVTQPRLRISVFEINDPVASLLWVV